MTSMIHGVYLRIDGSFRDISLIRVSDFYPKDPNSELKRGKIIPLNMFNKMERRSQKSEHFNSSNLLNKELHDRTSNVLYSQKIIVIPR